MHSSTKAMFAVRVRASNIDRSMAAARTNVHPDSGGRRARAAGRKRLSALHADPIRLDKELDALLTRLTEGVLVLVEILLRQLVDVLVGAVVRVLHDPSAHRHVLVRVLAVHDEQRHLGIAAYVLGPGPALGAVDRDPAVLQVAPDDGQVGAAVLAL